MRREAAVSRLCLATAAAVMFGAGVLVCGCGDDDDDSTPSSITVSLDGGTDVVLGSPRGQLGLGVYCTTSNPPIPALSTAVVAGAGQAPMSMMIFDGNQTGTFDIAAGEAQGIYVAADDTMYGAPGGGVGSGTVTVTTYGAVGELIVGTFNITAYEYDSVADNWVFATSYNLTGSFSVVRQVNNYDLGGP